MEGSNSYIFSNGNDVYFINYRIVGEFNLSKINHEIVSNSHIHKLKGGDLGRRQLYDVSCSETKCIYPKINENSSVIESKIIILNPIFEDEITFSNVQFRVLYNYFFLIIL
jgi:hypothetical protein